MVNLLATRSLAIVYIPTHVAIFTLEIRIHSSPASLSLSLSICIRLCRSVESDKTETDVSIHIKRYEIAGVSIHGNIMVNLENLGPCSGPMAIDKCEFCGINSFMAY